MGKLYTLIAFLGFTAFSFSQGNLVYNPSFEDGKHIKRGVFKIKHGSSPIDHWRAPLRHAPLQFLTPKKAVAVANTGYSAVGLLLGSSRQNKTKFQYITGKLKSPLEKDETYCVCFNVLLHRTSRWAATDVGVLLHHDRKVISDISDPTSMTATLYANDREAVTNTKWTRYCGYYRASGGEKYISFGKFGTSPSVKMKSLGHETHYETDNYMSKAFYQLDDISVVKNSGDIDVDCGCAEVPVVEEETQDSIAPKPSHPPYLFALDASGSMKRGGLFDSLRQNLTRFVRELPDGTPISFVTFASSSRKVFSGIVNSTTANTVDSLLSRAPIGGGTNVFVGLQLAYESWQSDGVDSAKMVLISDGEFHVTPKITDIVKNNYEIKGRKLTLIQIGARASGLHELEPYMDDYIHTTPSELSQVVSQLRIHKGQGTSDIAVPCDCEEEYSDTLNYHFVIDYSGSMREEKSRAIMAVRYLFEKIPDNAMISFTSFNRQAEELYVGMKSNTTLKDLTRLLRREQTGGGTDPVPGVQYALKLAEGMSHNRFSHIVLVTDLGPARLSKYVDLSRSMKSAMKRFDLAGSTITVDGEGLIALYSQFDEATGNHVGVGRIKFEKDLFFTKRSSCNYTSQPYHYSPSKAAMKTNAKKVVGKTFISIMNGALN